MLPNPECRIHPKRLLQWYLSWSWLHSVYEKRQKEHTKNSQSHGPSIEFQLIKKKTGKGFSNSQLWVWGKKQKQKITNKTKKIHKYTVWLGQQSTPTAPGNMIPLHESMLWSSLSYPHNELNPKIQLQGLGSNEPSPIQTFNNQQNQKRRQVRYNKQQGLYGMGQS